MERQRLKDVGENHYIEVHRWLRNHYGKANKCEADKCSSARYGRPEWALIHGKKYEKNRENFWMLCHMCHHLYDTWGTTEAEISYSVRITPTQDKKIKKIAKEQKISANMVIRNAIDTL